MTGSAPLSGEHFLPVAESIAGRGGRLKNLESLEAKKFKDPRRGRKLRRKQVYANHSRTAAQAPRNEQWPRSAPMICGQQSAAVPKGSPPVIGGIRSPKSGSHKTRRWSEEDSNRRSLSQNESVSPTERGVPERRKGLSRKRRHPAGDRGFESPSLQRRVCCEPDFLEGRRVQTAPAMRLRSPIWKGPHFCAEPHDLLRL